MRKLILSAAAIAAMASNAWAAEVPGSDVCGELPNSKWSWSIVEVPGSSSSVTTWGAITFSGASDNGTATMTVTTTTTPSSFICTALNPAGKVNEDHSTVAGGGDPVVTVVNTPGAVACVNSPNQTAPAGDLCRDPH